MKSVKIMFFCFLLCLTSAAQNLKIEYNVQLNILSRKGFLNITNNEMPFYYEQSVNNEKKPELNKDESKEIEHSYIIGLNDLDRWYQIYPIKNDTLFNIEYIGDKQVVYYDITAPKWEFKEEEKQIAGYNCSKAITTFRGRNYTAWFTPDIPIQHGPWKFKGLPGLILEIFDDQMSFSWMASKITETKINIEKAPDLKHLEKISFKKFVLLNDKDKEEEMNKVMLRFSEENMIITGGKSIRGRELKYEWEN